MSPGLHTFPPFFGVVSISRMRVCSPPSQDAEQSLQYPHSPQAQSTAMSQASSWQARTSFRSPWQGTPPYIATASIRRTRFCTPPSHVRVHSVQGSQSDSTQFCGSLHTWVLHGLVCVSSVEQTSPPCFGNWVTFLSLKVWPPPQSSVHLVQSLHSDVSQFCGGFSQSGSQNLVSVRGPWHGCPQKLFGSAISRCRSHRPRQVGGAHSLHSDQLQSRQFPPSHGGSTQALTSLCLPSQVKPASSACASVGRRNTPAAPLISCSPWWSLQSLVTSPRSCVFQLLPKKENDNISFLVGSNKLVLILHD
mmetsp:Transcript_3655/g.8742  ORF Transcript_3655/g.8742 Transcript_3655/m.8742 type:complete len:306 (-) Transcript_3655:3854-4771(-)